MLGSTPYEGRRPERRRRETAMRVGPTFTRPRGPSRSSFVIASWWFRSGPSFVTGNGAEVNVERDLTILIRVVSDGAGSSTVSLCRDDASPDCRVRPIA